VEARARRALAAVGFAAVVVAAIGVFYLRPWAGLELTSRPAPRPTPIPPAGTVLEEQFLSATQGWVVIASPDAATLFRTTDGGRHWQRQLAGTGGQSWTLSFFDSRRGVVAGVDARGTAIWRTADGGQRWTRLETPCQPPVRLISFVDPDRGWCIAPGASEGAPNTSPFPYRQEVTLYRTADGGVHWSRVLATDPTRPVSGGLGDDGQKAWIWFRDARTGWIGQNSQGGSAAVYATMDGGDTWDRQELSPPNGGWPSNLGLFEEGPQQVGAGSSPWAAVLPFQAGPTPGQFVVPTRYLYTLHSTTWAGPALEQTTGALFVDQARWLVAQGSSVLETTDEGENWRALGLVPAGWFVSRLTMVDRDHGWAVLFREPTRPGPVVANGLARTADGARTWTLVGLPA
jgi:photosystem II stability/assembly factor-like uncharacterized protein